MQADPDFLPRSNDFGLNQNAFREKFCASCPEPFYKIAFLCTDLNPDRRPPFDVTEVWLESLSMHLSVGMPLPSDLLFDILHYRGASPSSSGSTTPEGAPPGHCSPAALEPICERAKQPPDEPKDFPNYENIDFSEKPQPESKPKEAGVPLKKVPKTRTRLMRESRRLQGFEQFLGAAEQPLSLQNMKATALPSRVTEKYISATKIPDVVSSTFAAKRLPFFKKPEAGEAGASGGLVRNIIDSLNRKEKGRLDLAARNSYGRASLKVAGTPKVGGKQFRSCSPEEFTAL